MRVASGDMSRQLSEQLRDTQRLGHKASGCLSAFFLDDPRRRQHLNLAELAGQCITELLTGGPGTGQGAFAFYRSLGSELRLLHVRALVDAVERSRELG